MTSQICVWLQQFAKQHSSQPFSNRKTSFMKMSGRKIAANSSAPKFELMDDPEYRAHVYFAKHQLTSLFQEITAKIAAEKPKNPRSYMIKMVEDVMEKRSGESSVKVETKKAKQNDKELKYSLVKQLEKKGNILERHKNRQGSGRSSSI